MMTNFYCGKIAFIDLDNLDYKIEDTSIDLKRNYLGGNGFGVKLLYENTLPQINPLSPQNTLIFAVGPVTGTLLPSSSRFGVFAKSPLTGLFFDSYCGGTWGEQLKRAGFDALVIKGASHNPVSIIIENKKISFKHAENLWGLKTLETQKLLNKELGGDFTIATIGPAGENLVRYAAIISETRAAGRGGMGAVMGSKKLKAIAVKGTGDIYVHDPKGFMDYVRELHNRIKQHPGTGNVLPTFGTSVGASAFNDLGILGAYNWQKETFSNVNKISGHYMHKMKIYQKTKACLNCPIRCSKIAKAKKGIFQDYTTEGPEYETVFSFGSLCGNDDIGSIIAADRVCDELGLDTITAGAVLAFIMECYEKGILPNHLLNEVKHWNIMFGNLSTIDKILEMIAFRKGIGDFLAEGTQRMAEDLGREALELCTSVKGLEVPGHTARGLKGMGLGYAVSNRGGTHMDTRPTVERSGQYDPFEIKDKGKLMKDNQDMTAIGDSLIICRYTEGIFGFFINNDFVKMANLTTGLEYSLEDLRQIGERIYTLERMFNVREGINRSKDVLPNRFLNEPIADGPRKGHFITEEELNYMLDDYYVARGWDKETGIPTDETLNKLSLLEIKEKEDENAS
jgi:aldehyde:ferredoxin oxidoreductase